MIIVYSYSKVFFESQGSESSLVICETKTFKIKYKDMNSVLVKYPSQSYVGQVEIAATLDGDHFLFCINFENSDSDAFVRFVKEIQDMEHQSKNLGYAA